MTTPLADLDFDPLCRGCTRPAIVWLEVVGCRQTAEMLLCMHCYRDALKVIATTECSDGCGGPRAARQATL